MLKFICTLSGLAGLFSGSISVMEHRQMIESLRLSICGNSNFSIADLGLPVSQHCNGCFVLGLSMLAFGAAFYLHKTEPSARQMTVEGCMI